MVHAKRAYSPYPPKNYAKNKTSKACAVQTKVRAGLPEAPRAVVLLEGVRVNSKLGTTQINTITGVQKNEIVVKYQRLPVMFTHCFGRDRRGGDAHAHPSASGRRRRRCSLGRRVHAAVRVVRAQGFVCATPHGGEHPPLQGPPTTAAPGLRH